jgi:membrane-bound serine protease (ClpP class)
LLVPISLKRIPAMAAGALVLAVGASARAEVPVIDLVGLIHPVSAEYVVSSIGRAEAEGAPLVILRLDTPGGLDTSMRQIIDKMLSSKVPVAVFVGPSGARAASAGFLITVVADVAAMAPGTNMGAAHPVALFGQMDEVMSKKVASDAAAYIRSKVERRGRNVDLAEKAVIESKSFTDREALDGHLIDMVVKDIPALIAALDGRTIKRFDGAEVRLALAGQVPVPMKMDWRQTVLATLAQPEIILLLLLGAVVGLGTELTHPGVIVPGIIGGICLVLFLFAAQVIPINWVGVVLIVAGVGMFVAEIKVTSHGLLTVGGLVAIILGAMWLINSPVPEMRVPLTFILPAAATVAIWAALIVRLVVRAQTARVTTGAEGMLGEVGVADGPLQPDGWVTVHGEHWRAEAEAPVAAGERVVVTAVSGLRLRVRKGGGV